MHIDAKDELKEIFEELVPEKIRTGDVAGYASFFTRDATWSPPSQPEEDGPANIQAALAALLAQESINPHFTARDIEVCADGGYVFGDNTAIVTPTNGDPSSVAHTRELWVFRRESGAWKIHHMIWNLRPAD
jgi:uncharacterized protein (TIGR02246 family)